MLARFCLGARFNDTHCDFLDHIEDENQEEHQPNENECQSFVVRMDIRWVNDVSEALGLKILVVKQSRFHDCTDLDLLLSSADQFFELFFAQTVLQKVVQFILLVIFSELHSDELKFFRTFQS
jgi:hypothetical protein